MPCTSFPPVACDSMRDMEGVFMYGKRLAELRKDKKLSQRELADIFKIAKSSISMYELEKRDVPAYVKKGLRSHLQCDTSPIMA